LTITGLESGLSKPSHRRRSKGVFRNRMLSIDLEQESSSPLVTVTQCTKNPSGAACRSTEALLGIRLSF
jgi:hypothetical protein